MLIHVLSNSLAPARTLKDTLPLAMAERRMKSET
jgi:hypothetical protein